MKSNQLSNLGILNDCDAYADFPLDEFAEMYFGMNGATPIINGLSRKWRGNIEKLGAWKAKQPLLEVIEKFERYGRCLIPTFLLSEWMVSEICQSSKKCQSTLLAFDCTRSFSDTANLKFGGYAIAPDQIESIVFPVLKSRDVCLYQIAGDDSLVTTKRVLSADPATPFASMRFNKKQVARLKKPIVRYSFMEWQDLVARATVLHAASMLGIATRTLEIATEHARVRTVSGNVIGSYQAISHSLVDMLIAVEKLRSLIVFAGETYGTSDFSVAVAMAKSASNRTALDNTHRTIQILGAKGFQWSFPLNFFLRRAIVGVSLFGETVVHNDYVLEKIRKPEKVSAKRKTQTAPVLSLAITDNSESTGGARGSREVFQ